MIHAWAQQMLHRVMISAHDVFACEPFDVIFQTSFWYIVGPLLTAQEGAL